MGTGSVCSVRRPVQGQGGNTAALRLCRRRPMDRIIEFQPDSAPGVVCVGLASYAGHKTFLLFLLLFVCCCLLLLVTICPPPGVNVHRPQSEIPWSEPTPKPGLITAIQGHPRDRDHAMSCANGRCRDLPSLPNQLALFVQDNS